MGRTGEFRGVIHAPADDVFAAVTDVAHLDEWNDRILEVVEQPDHVVRGAEWVVRMTVLGQRFKSRSQALVVDADARRFVHRSSPDGDPDFAIWTWEVDEHEDEDGVGSLLRVSWDLNPVLWINRTFFVRVRTRQLPKDLEASRRGLERFVGSKSHTHHVPTTDVRREGAKA